MGDPAADVTIGIPRKALEQLALNPSVRPAVVVTTGNSSVFDRFVGTPEVFDPGFNIVIL